MKRNKIYIILGPTSSGKTSLALDLCKKYNGEIISADSRQIYKYMDIGTGKLPLNQNIKVDRGEGCWVLDDIKIWGYNLTAPDVFFSGYDFAIFALKKAREIVKSGKNVFLVGGTGFYIDLFTGRVAPSKVKPDLDLRENLNLVSLDDLILKLSKLNPEVLEKIDKNNKVRLIRAIERELSKEVNETNIPYLSDYDFVYIGLNAPREFLYKKAGLWVDEIFEEGIVKEVESLISKGYENSSKLSGLIYKFVVQLINKKLPREYVIQQCKFDIHKYIKRQLTYFRKNKDIFWVDVSRDDYRKIIYNKMKEDLVNE